ncbi:MAG: hypothetical protein LQ347_006559, partial [Umbilicaria vellea]
MRSIIQTALFIFVLLSTLAAPYADSKLQPQPVEDILGIQTAAPEPVDAGAAAGATNSEAISEAPTTFNAIEVPPMKELDGDKFDEDVKDGYWFVKHYSPYCHHCIAIAPTWQTLYEFYYVRSPRPGDSGATADMAQTSKPLASSTQSADTQTSMNSFQRYYNFRFASLDCVAFGDACTKHDIKAFPTFTLYKDGLFIKKFDGARDMAGLNHFIEETLETIRPGSRPKDGFKLPEPGAKSVETGAQPDVPLEKDKNAVAGAAAAVKQKEKAATPAVAPVKQNEKVATKPTEVTTTKASLQASKVAEKPTKPKVVPNPLGTSVPLSAEGFQKLVTTSQDPWFIKFYVPWCHHCQALAPNWLQMSKELQGKLNVGEVNCDTEPRLCKDVRVKGYPTIHFFRGGERVEYDGLRGLGDLVSYAKKALDIGSGVKYVDALTFKEMEETEEVIFVYFYDHATTSEDFEALERLTLSLIGHARIVKTDSALLAERFKISTWPRLLVSRDGRPTYYNALAPKDMRDFRQVLNWMQSVWLPIVPELTASNSREIMDGRYVVLGILNRERPEDFLLDKREIKNAALEWMDKQMHAFQLERQEMRDGKQLRIEEAEDRNDQRALRAAKSIRIQIGEDDKKQVGFGWVDGVFWQRWIRTTYGIDVREGERVIINDED